jgi:hypothetical protein
MMMMMMMMIHDQKTPALITIDAHGKTINNEAIFSLANDPMGAKFPWKPPALRNLDDSNEVAYLLQNYPW